jgi:predicted nuclease with TOPRIM domain
MDAETLKKKADEYWLEHGHIFTEKALVAAEIDRASDKLIQLKREAQEIQWKCDKIYNNFSYLIREWEGSC